MVVTTAPLFFLYGCITPSASNVPNNIQTCTAIGCGFSLQIEIGGDLPSDFILIARTPTGEMASVHYANESTIHDEASVSEISICGRSSISFQNDSPDEVSISIQWEGREIAQDYQPTYKVFRPNGLQCEPECRSATVTIFIPN